MEIKELRCFAHVAEALNFNRAAEQLSISQPVVTKTIAQLEHRLGAKLFERTTRRVALTAAGVVLKREVDGLLTHFDSVQRAIHHTIAARSYRLTVGVTPLAMQTLFPKVIRGFREAHPEVEVEILELPTDAQVKALLSAEIDIAYILAPASHPELEVLAIHEEPMRLAIPTSHPHLKSLGEGPIPLSAFAGDIFIIPLRTRNPGVHDEIIRACAVSGFRPKVQECHENQSCLSLVEAGLGLSFVTSQSEKLAQGDGVKVIDLESPVPVLSIATAWRKDDPSPLLKSIRDLTIRAKG